MEVSQAVETPIIKTPIDTPISNFQELEIYSFKTVSFKWIQFSENGKNKLKIIINAGIEKSIPNKIDGDKKIEDFSKNLRIPIINLLSPSSHPCQVLSDIFTVEEIKKKSISKLNISWIGDSNNVLNSLIATSVKFKFKLNIGCPKNYRPPKFVIDWVKKNGRKIYIYNDPKKAVKNADVIFSDKVVSLSDRVNKKKKIKDFRNYRVNSSLLKYAKRDVIFLHCLPRGNEVTDDVFLGNKSKVWQQAENRIHVQKSILLYCFDKLR